MTPATISLPFEAALPVRRISANASLNLVILVCWSLGAVCISTSGMESGGSGIFELVKAGTRGFAFLALGAIVVAAQNASPSRAIWRLTPVALFALWAMVSTLWSPLKSVTLTHGFELLILVLLAMAIAIVCREERAMERLLGHLVTITCFVCILVLGLNFQMVRAGMRPMLYMQPNNLAAVGASGLILMCLSRVLWNWRWTTKMFWPVVMVCGATMYAARSRSAFIASSFVLLPLFWRIGRERFAVAIVFVLAVIAALWPYSRSVSSLPDSVTAYVMRGQNMDEAYTFSGRTELWGLAAESLRTSPVFGYGYFVLGKTGEMYVWGAVRRQTAHNLYLHIITGTGIAGSLLFAWAMLFALTPVWTSWRRRDGSEKTAKLVLAFVAWIAALGFFELSIGGPIDPMVLMFFTLVGLAAGWCPAQREEVHAYARLAAA